MKDLLLLAVLCLAVCGKHLKSRLKKETPKANRLMNVYSFDPLVNSYGPVPRVMSQSGLQISSMGDIELVKQDALIHCDHSHVKLLSFCLSIEQCDVCTTSHACGWCAMRGVCLPKDSQEQKICGQEPCRASLMIEHMEQCGTLKVSGAIDKGMNASEVKGIIKPELTEPKYKVNSIIDSPEVVTTPVLLGLKQENHVTEYKDLYSGQVVKRREYKNTKPLYGEVRQVRNVQTYQQDIVDAKTLKRLDSENVLSRHGIDLD